MCSDKDDLLYEMLIPLTFQKHTSLYQNIKAQIIDKRHLMVQVGANVAKEEQGHKSVSIYLCQYYGVLLKKKTIVYL